MHAVGKSHIGKLREQNQDAVFVNTAGLGPLPNLFVVADGMGGHSSGDIASSSAMAAFCGFFDGHELGKNLEDCLVAALAEANAQVHSVATNNAEYHGMGTTFSAATIKDKKLYYAHVGDSRIYLIEYDKISQLTKDHSTLTADMLREGIISEEEAKGYPPCVLNRAIGTDPDVIIDSGVADLEGVKYVLICSDGLADMISNDMILEIFKQGKDDVALITDVLVQAALDGGGRDNISVIVIGGEAL